MGVAFRRHGGHSLLDWRNLPNPDLALSAGIRLRRRVPQQRRSYAEHRFADHHHERTAIVENSPLFGPLFLYNNLHVLHHQRPGMPWYRIPRLYRRHRNLLVSINGGLVYDGYLDVARRFLLTSHDDPRYPRHAFSEPLARSHDEGVVTTGETQLTGA